MFNSDIIFNIDESCIISGLTETGIIAYQRQSGKPGSSGYVSQNVCLKIISLDPLDREKSLGLNMQGEICCTSPYMMIHKDDESAAHDS